MKFRIRNIKPFPSHEDTILCFLSS